MMRRWFVLLSIAIAIGYGSTWAAYYVQIFYPEELRVLGDLSKFERPCTSQKTEKSECTHEYTIPSSSLEKFNKSGSLGAGLIISASTYQCLKPNAKTPIVFDDPQDPGKLFDLLHRYQTVDLFNLSCDDGVSIRAWSQPLARRTGHIGGTAVVGSSRAVERVKTLSDFFTTDILVLFAFLFIALFFLSKIMTRIVMANLTVNPFEPGLIYWLLFILLSSGLLQKFIPITSVPQLYNRAAALFSLLAHFGPLSILGERSATPRIFREPIRLLSVPIGQQGYVRLYTLISIALVFSPSFILLFGPLFTTIATITLLLAVINRDALLICYGIAFILTGLKILDVPGLPHSQVTTFFVGLVVSNDLIARFKQGAKLTSLLMWSKNIRDEPQKTRSLEDLIKEGHAQIGAGDFSVLRINPEGGCEIISRYVENGTIKIERFVRDSLPDVFAHAISRRNPVWHVDEAKMRVIRKYRAPKRKYIGHFSTVVPLLGERYPVGAFAFTNYPENWVQDQVKNLELTTIVSLLRPLLTDQLNKENLTLQSEAYRKFSDLINEIATIKSHLHSSNDASLDPGHFFQELIQTICESLSAFGYIAELNEKTRLYTILGIHGYPKEVHDRLTQGRLEAKLDNEQGPIALAANKREIIITCDVWLDKEVFHPNSMLFFKKSGTKSCAAIPIYSAMGDNVTSRNQQNVWGILFLERRTEERFGLHFETVFSQLSAALSDILGTANQTDALARVTKALATFAPQYILERIQNGEDPKEPDFGLLLKLDLAGSTRIALDLGSDAWNQYTSILKPEIDLCAAHCGLSVQYFLWDAWYFTSSGEKPSKDMAGRVSTFISQVAPIIYRQAKIYFSALSRPEYGNASRQMARFCVSFGDTSRGLVEGATGVKHWTITGAEMAAVNKLEEACKELPGILFCDSTFAPAIDMLGWSDTGYKVLHNERIIYTHSTTWLDLARSFKI